jgi:hypothetical protein
MTFYYTGRKVRKPSGPQTDRSSVAIGCALHFDGASLQHLNKRLKKNNTARVLAFSPEEALTDARGASGTPACSPTRPSLPSSGMGHINVGAELFEKALDAVASV